MFVYVYVFFHSKLGGRNISSTCYCSMTPLTLAVA